MQIDPRRQLALFLAAFLLGASMRVFRMLLLSFRTLTGAYVPPERMRARYEKRLPLLGRGVRFERGATHRAWYCTVIFLTDLLFCLVFCVSLILLLYRYNDGAWRLSVPVLSFAGYALFSCLSARFFIRANDYLAYLFALIALYVRAALCLPVRIAWRLLRRFALHPLQKGWCTLCEKRKRSYTVSACHAELALAAKGFLMEERKRRNVKKEDHAFGMDDTLSDHSVVLRGAVRGISAAGRMARAEKAKRGAGERKV